MTQPSHLQSMSSTNNTIGVVSKRPRLMDDAITSAQTRFDAASEKIRFHQKEIEFHQLEIEKARVEILNARTELQSQGLGSIDSLLILSDDCLKAVFPFCDWFTLLKLEITCKRINKLTESEWECRDRNIDNSSKFIDYDDDDDDYNTETSLCKLYTIRFERAAAFAKRLQPMVHAHRHVGAEDDEEQEGPKCRGCSDFPSETNLECFQEDPPPCAYFIRIFSPSDQNNYNGGSDNTVISREDRSLLWQGFLHYDGLWEDEHQQELSLKVQNNFDFHKTLPDLQKFLSLLRYEDEDGAGNLSEDERNRLLTNNPNDRQQMLEKAVGNVGLILVALNSSDEKLSLLHATAKFDFEQDVGVNFKPMKQQTHSKGIYTNNSTSIEMKLGFQSNNLDITLFHWRQ